ncbi:hypothetical protein [Paraburkholderia fynbosensis]|nr:hypothetical protein [Paraburkholderia fynbosensis]
MFVPPYFSRNTIHYDEETNFEVTPVSSAGTRRPTRRLVVFH